MVLVADARPTKRFFIDMLTADIALEDAILDMVDNSIDSLVHTQRLSITPKLLLSTNGSRKPKGTIHISLSDKQISIEDNCGGIEFDRAKNEIFRLGKLDDPNQATLGVYGIGMKRAIFKMGNAFEIVSRTKNDGFIARVDDLDAWSKDDSKWEIEIKKTQPAKSLAAAGTRIVVSNLRPEVLMRLENGTLENSISEALATTYALFLKKTIAISLNKKPIEGRLLPYGKSKEITPYLERVQMPGKLQVSLILMAGMASRKLWSTQNAGWYILCNGRVIVAADKTTLTGWGQGMAQYVSKYRGFIGIAFFYSKHPANLPWKTTKKGINTDSRVFQIARPKMIIAARPVLEFLNEMYPSDEPESAPEREIAKSLESADFRPMAQLKASRFTVKQRTTLPRFVRVQYDAKPSEIERVKRRITQPNWSARQVGRFTLDHYLKTEC